ncbi:hypothetical protein KKF81_01800 [Candidatus Micrarchaeota archaeon]|nr:hypothetical protein [Candidatus Micrarchaeota archaeon]MBU1165654.1 hypothetical protein [Candidatus Micrarchaeota archaeon]MBU1887201.1 hypothetical protein [Candidatus Micrarchaeota archaeon]
MLPNIYKGNYRLLAIPPLLLIIIAIFFIPSIKLGVDFQGGTLVTLSLEENVDAEMLQTQLRDEGLDANVKVFDTAVGYRAEIEVPQSDELVQAETLKDEFNTLVGDVSRLEVLAYGNTSYEPEYITKKTELDAIADQMFGLIEIKRSQMNISTTNDLQKRFSDAYSEVYKQYQRSISEPINKHVRYTSISVQTVSPVLSSHFIDKVASVVLFSAILSVILVFLFFRAIIPSIAVLTGAFSDIVIALGAMGLFGIPLTLPSFAALLMLVGFSLDTDILLTTRMLKRRGDPRENAHDAMKTGLTMSVTGLIAFGALFILSTMTHIPTYYEISAVALAGLVGDMFATWGINAVMILYYAEKRGAK